MSTVSFPLLPSFRKQHLLVEFAALEQRCPDGLYLSLTPDNPSLWPGVLFVREGPYASAVLRFLIAFPDTFPDVPPLITFSTDLFHPLLVPLTTYTFSAGIPDSSGSANASEHERLPPGSFNLSHGFPEWFGSRRQHGEFCVEENGLSSPNNHDSTSEPRSDRDDLKGSIPPFQKLSILNVLDYMKTSFQSALFLDGLPLEAAGNPSALHAWRAYRGLPKLSSSLGIDGDTSTRSPMRNPGDWNWDGVWESRVHEGIEMSTSEGSLFGTKTNPFASSEPIRFSKFSDEQTREVQETISS